MTPDSNGATLVGMAKTDITPPPDCILDGFAARDHGAEGIHDNLYAVAMAISRNGGTAVIVGLDLLELSDEQMDSIWMRARDSFGLEPSQLFINCSHTHAAPIIRPRFNKKFCPPGGVCMPDEAYIGRMLDGIMDAIGGALDKRQPARLQRGLGQTHIGIFRRAHDTEVYKGPPSGYIGIYANIPNPHKDVDRTCPVIMARDLDGRPLGVLFGAPSHPTTMSHPNYLVSAEYPGAARNVLEERFDGAPALFVQGIGGDIKPKRVAGEDAFRSGTFEDVAAVGGELAADVVSVIENGLEPFEPAIRSSLDRFPLPFDERWGEREFGEFAKEGQAEHRRNWAKHWRDRLARGESIPKSMDITLSILELAPGFRLLGISGELLTDMGLKLKGHFDDGVTLPCGYTNGRIGYVPNSQVLREGGYEAWETVFFTNGMPAPWRDDIDDTLTAAFDRLAGNLK